VTPDRAQILADVRAGLLTYPRQIPSKYFYDEYGSQLFDEITRLPEYYPTRAERALLAETARRIVATAVPATLTELGAGSSDKTRLLLDEMLRVRTNGATYIPVDVSSDFLDASAARLREEYPTLDIIPLAADFSTQFTLPQHPIPALHAFLGSTIGNFTPAGAIDLLARVRARMSASDHFRKDPAVIESAYNDSRGVTAAFNRNMLNVINDKLGANFNLAGFEHNAVYDVEEHRIEMRLISTTGQRVSIPDIGNIDFGAGEAILTELSYKYDRDDVASLFASGGLTLVDWFTDDDQIFALALATA
jgi:L-histidine N-alpha-methyltransferase